MKFAPKSAAALAPILLALAACGGGSDDDAAGEATPEATDTAAPADAATPAPGETPSPTASPSETPSPTPTPSASATTAAAAEPGAFAQCKACHSVERGKNGIGPSLAGIYGDRAATVPGFEFSDPMKNSGLTWNQSTLDRYLTDPRGVVPGTKMAFGGVKDAAQRQAIINYLKTL
jgi:cytochrome c2